MIPFDTYSLMLANEEVMYATWPNIWRLGVVVFTRPEEQICKEIIKPSLQYLHELTGEKVHFYFVGFCNRHSSKYNLSVSRDFMADEGQWYFSPQYFSQVQSRFEALTNNHWQYTGGTDLLVVPYRIRKYVFYIDSSKALDIKLTKIARQNKNYIPEEIIQIIVRQMCLGKDIDGVSNSRVMEAISEGFKRSLLKFLPQGISGSFDILEPFAVRDLSS